MDLTTERGVSEVIFTGSITGVKLITSSYFKRPSIVVADRKKYCVRGVDSGESSNGESEAEESTTETVGMTDIEITKFRKVGDCFFCRRCGISFKEQKESETYYDCADIMSSPHGLFI